MSEKGSPFGVALRDLLPQGLSPGGADRTAIAVDVRGDIDLFSVPQFRNAMNAALPLVAPGGLLLINLAEVPFIDSTAQGYLLAFARSTRRHGGDVDARVALCCGAAGVMRSLRLLGVLKYLPLYDTEADALRAESDAGEGRG